MGLAASGSACVTCIIDGKAVACDDDGRGPDCWRRQLEVAILDPI